MLKAFITFGLIDSMTVIEKFIRPFLFIRRSLIRVFLYLVFISTGHHV